eukprot:9111392-Alexandrium_andersonii.AAC.1
MSHGRTASLSVSLLPMQRLNHRCLSSQNYTPRIDGDSTRRCRLPDSARSVPLFLGLASRICDARRASTRGRSTRAS